MRLFSCLALSILILLLGGCSGLKKEKPKAAPAPPPAKYSSQDLDILLRFGDELARLPADQKLAECNHILELSRLDPGLGLQLHLFVAQLLSEKCGSLRETSASLKPRLLAINDQRVRYFLSFQDQVLARLEGEISRRKALDVSLKSTRQQALKRKRELITFESEAKNCESDLMTCESNLERRRNELDALKGKLEELTKIEEELTKKDKIERDAVGSQSKP